MISEFIESFALNLEPSFFYLLTFYFCLLSFYPTLPLLLPYCPLVTYFVTRVTSEAFILVFGAIEERMFVQLLFG
jgi:hypothetical protein